METNYKKKLKDYAIEIFGYSITFTIDDLISSHRVLRESHIKDNIELAKARTEAYEHARQYIIETEALTIDELKDMTMSEVCELLRGGYGVERIANRNKEG